MIVRVHKLRRSIRKRRRLIFAVLVPAALLAVNVPPAWAFISEYRHEQLIHSAEYVQQNGRWDVIDLPADVRVNAIHAALLSTGKLLIVAGSGNDQQQFDAGTFKTLLYDPGSGQTKLVPTPADLFCAGHAFLPDGKLLVAGGTLRYEVLAPQVTRAAGAMLVKNESPDLGRTLPKGSEFVGPTGRVYRSTSDLALPPATKLVKGKVTKVTASQDTVFVEAEGEGADWVTQERTQYSIRGVADPANFYGIADKMTMEKQEFQGIADSYEFDPVEERYVRVGDLHHKRWYPTLTGLPGGDVLAASGLDGTGQVLDGQTEIYSARAKAWTDRPDLKQYFPTYPALFSTARPNWLFYSGSSSGYGPDDKGRDPGFWDLSTNIFQKVPGIRDPDQLETSGSGWVGPFQDQKLMVVGGGGVGESDRSTGRIDLVDLRDPTPHFTPGPDLPEGTRYPLLVQLPDDTTLITGGSRDYRGKGASDNHDALLFQPDTNTLTRVADPSVGRDYHSEGLLLPDGRVMTMGSNPLFEDADNTTPAPFEQRLEIFTPAYLFHGPRPEITSVPAVANRGQTIVATTPDAPKIVSARLIAPAAATHAIDVGQRTVALVIDHRDGALGLTLPAQQAVLPAGYYMLFLTDANGTPSVARWVHVL